MARLGLKDAPLVRQGTLEEGLSQPHAAILTPQDIRSVAVARGYRWCVPGGHWYHKSAEAQHGGFRCKVRRRSREARDDREND